MEYEESHGRGVGEDEEGRGGGVVRKRYGADGGDDVKGEEVRVRHRRGGCELQPVHGADGRSNQQRQLVMVDAMESKSRYRLTHRDDQ